MGVSLELKNEDEFWNGIKYFIKNEFECRCGCGFNCIDEDLVKALDNSRKLANVKFIINSACRCEKYNSSKEVGGEINSSHLKGLAVDIHISSDRDRFKILTSLLYNGFNRIGVYKNFIHCDLDKTKPQNVVWYK